jgi:RNA recognition motif-containing protein
MKIDYEPPKEFKNFDYICKWCHKQDKDVCQMEDGSYYHKSCFDKELGDTGFCVYCGKKNGSET